MTSPPSPPASRSQFQSTLPALKYTSQFVDVMDLPTATHAMPLSVGYYLGQKENALINGFT